MFFLYSAGWRTFSADFRLAAFIPADFRPVIIFRRILLKFGGWGSIGEHSRPTIMIKAATVCYLLKQQKEYWGSNPGSAISG